MFTDEWFILEIKAIEEKLSKKGLAIKRCQFPSDFDQEKLLKKEDREGMILATDTVIELGHPATASYLIIMITQQNGVVSENKVTVIGYDLQELSPGRHSFALIMLAKSNESSEKERKVLLSSLSRCDHLTGCMVRITSGKIWIRFSQEALDKGITLETVGRFLFADLNKNKDKVEKAEIILIVAGKDEIDMLMPVADGLAEERSKRYRAALAEKMACETGLDCDECPETETCQVLKDAVAISKRKKNST